MDASQITLIGQLALHWESIDALPGDAELGQYHERNLDCLRQALLLDEFYPAMHEDRVLDMRDSNRLERKLDLMLSLLGSMINTQRSTQTYAVRLSTDTLQWTPIPDTSLPTAAMLTVQLYLHPYAVAPLQLFAAGAMSENGQYQISLDCLTAAEQELLQRYLFLNHRRQIAAVRQGQ